MVVRWAPGGVLRIDLGSGGHAWAVMLAEFPHVAFYSMEDGPREGKSLPAAPLFVVPVERVAYSRGGWGEVLFRLPAAALPPIPLYFRQDDYAVDSCVLVDRDGSERRAGPQECVGLEREAVWGDTHVEDRLRDYYAGRRNEMAEQAKVRLG